MRLGSNGFDIFEKISTSEFVVRIYCYGSCSAEALRETKRRSGGMRKRNGNGKDLASTIWRCAFAKSRCPSFGTEGRYSNIAQTEGTQSVKMSKENRLSGSGKMGRIRDIRTKAIGHLTGTIYTK